FIQGRIYIFPVLQDHCNLFGLIAKGFRLYVFPEPSADEEAENDEDHADHGQLGEFGQYLFDDLTLKIADFHYAAQLFCLVSSIDGAIAKIAGSMYLS